jgi:neutral amino acid transport system permease protein
LLSRTSVPGRGLFARAAASLGLFMLVAPLLLLFSSSSSEAATFCLPKKDETACIAGTMGSRADPIADVDVILTKPDGSTETQTTEKDGKFSFEVTEAGDYLVGVDPDTLPKGSELRPPAEAALRGPDGALKVDHVELGKTYAATLTVRAEGFSNSSSTWDEFAQSAVNGLRLGLLLALASVGLSLIYGTTGLSNFAHAEQVTLGGMVGYGLINVAGWNLWLGGVGVIVICAFSGWLQDRVLWQPLRRRGLGLTQLMIVTIGLSLAMQYSFQYFVGADVQRVVVAAANVRKFGPVTITDQSLSAMGISAVVLIAVGFALLRTRIGRATRAVSDNPALAQASGIDTDKVIRLVWTVAMGLAGLSGLLYALVTNGIKWDTGLQILLLLFAAVTLGGLGTAFGALLGSIVIGLVVELSPLVIPGDFKYAAALLILILLLMVRPQGLLGRAQRVG